MINYGIYSKNTFQKIFILVFEIGIIFVSYKILFAGWADNILQWLHIFPVRGNYFRLVLIFTFNIVVFLAYAVSLLFFLKRKISWAEAINVVFAFAVYFIGFPLLAYKSNQPLNWVDLLGIILFLLGISLHLASEWQRFSFKKQPQNKGKLLTSGFWSLSRHINYFADVVWVSGYALVSRNPWSALIVGLLICFFYCFNIPEQEKYLAQKYGSEFAEYKSKVKALIPFVL